MKMLSIVSFYQVLQLVKVSTLYYICNSDFRGRVALLLRSINHICVKKLYLERANKIVPMRQRIQDCTKYNLQNTVFKKFAMI